MKEYYRGDADRAQSIEAGYITMLACYQVLWLVDRLAPQILVIVRLGPKKTKVAGRYFAVALCTGKKSQA